MKSLRILGAIAVLVAAAATSNASFAAGRGPGPCTRPGDRAVGAEGPALNGGQWMAGVGQCGHGRAWRNSYGYYRGPVRDGYYGRGYYDRGYGYGYDEPGVSFGFGAGY